MDPIRNLVSGADPIGNDPDAPDGEEALRSMFSQPQDFADRVAPNVPTLAERRQRRHRIAGILSVAAAAMTAGVLFSLNLGPQTAAPVPAGTSTATASPAPSSNPSPTPVPSPASTIGTSDTVPALPPSTASLSPGQAWRTYVSADGRISFEFPTDWTVQQPQTINPAYPAVGAVVTDQAGRQVASLRYGASGGIGGACLGPPVPYAVLDSVELALPYNSSFPDVITPRFAFRVLLEGDKVTASYGITSSAAGKDGTACMFYNVVNGPKESPLYSFSDAFQVSAGDAQPESAKTFGTLDEARAYMLTPEYLNVRRMITSLKIQGGQ